MFRVDLLLAPLLLLPERTEHQHHDHHNRDCIILVKSVDRKFCIIACAKLPPVSSHQQLHPCSAPCQPAQILFYPKNPKTNSPANPQKYCCQTNTILKQKNSLTSLQNISNLDNSIVRQKMVLTETYSLEESSYRALSKLLKSSPQLLLEG